MALVVAANKESTELGGHVASYASAATLYDIGFNHFWHAPSEKHGGDLLYLQGHSSPGFYARAFLDQLERAKPAPRVAEWERIANEMRLVAERAVSGKISVDQAAKELDARADDILEKRRWMLAHGGLR